MRRLLTGVLAMLVLAGVYFGVYIALPSQSLPTAAIQPPPPAVDQAELEPEPPVQSLHEEMLAQLEIKGRAPKTGYEREEFGQAWSDDVDVEFGHNGCDTRNDILRRDLEDPHIRPGTYGCLVESGILRDPYSGKEIHFERGDRQIEIDHVVALANAWVTGARYWDEETRRNFANDPLNLNAVSTHTNRAKGAGDAATWQPPNKEYRCRYAQQQIEVKYRYHLWVTAAEAEALARNLERCNLSI